jgi:hypothetical protein
MKISRRAIIEALGAAAIGASAFEIGEKHGAGLAPPALPPTARFLPPPRRPVMKDGKMALTFKTSAKPCYSLSPLKPRVLLVCHGMMMSFYRESEPDYFYILVPNPNMKNSAGVPIMMHEVSLTDSYADTNNRLAPAGTYRQGGYELRIRPSSKKRYLRADSAFYCKAGQGFLPKTEEVVLSDSKSTKYRLTPNTDIWKQYGATAYKPDPDDPIWFSIKVPYPTFVFPFGGETFSSSNPAYGQGGHTAMDFGANPSSLPGMHILYYEDVDQSTAADLVYSDPASGNSISNPLKATTNLKIQLYSQPPKHVPPPNHLDLFNNMVKYASYPHLDLDAPAMYYGNLNSAPSDIDSDLEDADYHDLADFLEPTPIDGSTADPVECLQGWGT